MKTWLVLLVLMGGCLTPENVVQRCEDVTGLGKCDCLAALAPETDLAREKAWKNAFLCMRLLAVAKAGVPLPTPEKEPSR